MKMRFFDLFKRSPRQPEPDIQQLVADEAAVAESLQALPLPDAEAEARAYLADDSRFRTEAGSGILVWGNAYGPTLQQFFARYRRVASLRSEVELEGGPCVRSENDPGFYLIGFYWEHVEVVVAPGRDEIVVLDTEARLEALYRFPTILHFICFLGRTETP